MESLYNLKKGDHIDFRIDNENDINLIENTFIVYLSKDLTVILSLQNYNQNIYKSKRNIKIAGYTIGSILILINIYLPIKYINKKRKKP